MSNLNKLLTILIVTGLSISCSNKKDDLPLFLALVGGDQGGGTGTVQAPSGGNTGVDAPDGSVVEQVDDSTVVIHLPSEEENSETTTETTGSGTEENTAKPETTVTTGSNDVIGEKEFTYQTSNTVPVNMVVNDDNGPVSGAIVTIVDTTDGENPDILFQQATDSTGTASGSINVPTTTESVQANINLGDKVVSTTIPTSVTDEESGTTQNVVAVDRDVTVSGTHNPTNHFTDSDGDGIADASDDYPNDPTRATMTRYPKSGVNTLAFEDLFPRAGDADLNDYVVFFSTEEDLNSQGRVVGIRGYYQHVARGAGYRHTLNLKLNVPTGATFSAVTTKSRNNKDIQESSGEVQMTAEELQAGFELLGSSAKTISTPNNRASHANNLKFGDYINFEITFNEPVTRQQLGSAPYDVYIYVINTKKNIHLPGRHFDASGKDIYMDNTGFPWAIIVPGKWKWPLEGVDIRNPSRTGYADFITWMESRGQEKKDWFSNVTDASKVFPLPDESSLAGYLAKAAQNNWLALALGLLIVGLATGYFLTRKNQAILSK